MRDDVPVTPCTNTPRSEMTCPVVKTKVVGNDGRINNVYEGKTCFRFG